MHPRQPRDLPTPRAGEAPPALPGLPPRIRAHRFTRSPLVPIRPEEVGLPPADPSAPARRYRVTDAGSATRKAVLVREDTDEREQQVIADAVDGVLP